MQSGYAYECFYHYGDPSSHWSERDNEDWETVVYTPDGSEEWVGSRVIDGSTCNVWRCTLGFYRAQTTVMTGRK